MVSRPLSHFSAVRKRHLLVEFSGLKHACPHGVFMSLTPDDYTLWSGVIFVRKGPYAPAILRFQISFPPSYPELPPLVTFSTDIFHPLITPLSTYMYSTDVQAEGTVSATDDERLPPGGMSLRHGFPGWFGRGSRNKQQDGKLKTPVKDIGGSPGSATSGSPTPGSTGKAEGNAKNDGRISIYEVLRYIRSTFDNEDVLDSVPLEAAGNPGAWHAWRTHRVKSEKFIAPALPPKDGMDGRQWHDGLSDGESEGSSSVLDRNQRLAGETKGTGKLGTSVTSRRPGEWNWEGVWEVRVKKGVDASLAEAVLFGKDSGGDDLIRFLSMEAEEVETVKDNIRRSVETVEPTRREVV